MVQDQHRCLSMGESIKKVWASFICMPEVRKGNESRRQRIGYESQN